jgi:hypothetical protein
MFNKLSIAAVVLSSLAFTSASQADEVSLDSLVGNMLSTAVTATQQELSFDVQKAVLAADQMIDLEASDSYSTVVTINDINVAEAKQDKAE